MKAEELADGFEESNEDYSTDKRDDKAPEVETSDGATNAEETKDPAPKDSPYDTDDNVQDNTLLAVGAHEHRGNPADDTTENNIDEETHKRGDNRLAILAIEFDGCFRGGDGLAHHEHLDDTPGDDVVDKHGEDSGPLKDTPFDFGDTEDGDKWRSEWCGHHIDEVGETGRGIGSEKLQDETKSEEDFDEAKDIPDDLGTAVEGLSTA